MQRANNGTSDRTAGGIMEKFEFYIGGLVQTVTAASEREGYAQVKKLIIDRNGGLDNWLRGVLNGRDTLKTVNNRLFRRVSDLRGK
jgi:hypothetical protein